MAYVWWRGCAKDGRRMELARERRRRRKKKKKKKKSLSSRERLE